jgi:hypothetical protein
MMMMSLQQRITAFVQLGHGLRALAASPDWPGFACGLTREEFDQVRSLMDTVKARNGWFTPEAVVQSFAAWGENLREEPLRQWLSVYQLPEIQESPATVAVICAGNIPMVGFHDVLSILITGHRALIKYSSDDDVLIPAVLQLLVRIEPGFAPMIAWAEGKLHNFDAVIATGSTNTSRYFHQYFSAYPHIIRKGRTSVAVLTGDETEEELLGLGRDIFDYYGLGCRSVSKMYVPRGYVLDTFFKGIFSYSGVVNHNKYANNYDYNKAVWLLNNENLLDNGFILLKEDTRVASPTGSLYYEYYDDLNALEASLEAQSEALQCIISRNHVPFGQSQAPGLADYADGVDTIAFLQSLRVAAR